ncbi:hypothetical protein MHLP_02685 [Candidatus Mycoplasma haematolamae str. Purdue]|uniref:Uncharacterized protein n=1 Tax=Mycoplasma haematolamae (strain Purdue) TaxID=1212765 RepID=I7C6H5_MYCHA|nr:hypothetical protein [Candidatus Mycoplasma haematolamae]AFO52117.1 hypothetical protein MHLP_02685 [Candidatus Mycoplasma haematolamae str. Purdue]
MIGAGIAKLALGSTLFAGTVGGSVVAFGLPNLSGLEASDNTEHETFKVKISGLEKAQEHTVTCSKHSKDLATLSLSSSYEEYRFTCSSSKNDTKRQGKMISTVNEGSSHNELSCEYKPQNTYECIYKPLANGTNKFLKKVITSSNDGGVKYVLELRPNDRE